MENPNDWIAPVISLEANVLAMVSSGRRLQADITKIIGANIGEYEMTNDQIIHEAMRKCWHEWEPQESHWSCCGFASCKKCGFNTDREERDYNEEYQNPDYSKWENYGPMLEWAQKQEWWLKLAYEEVDQDDIGTPIYDFNTEILNPTRGRDAIAEFLKEHKL